MKQHKMSFRADDPLFQGIKSMAEKRGMSISDYLRMMASLELLSQPALPPPGFLQDLKSMVAEMDEYATRDPAEQVALLQRSIDAIAKGHR
jgi:negative regulator of replication initiation